MDVEEAIEVFVVGGSGIDRFPRDITGAERGSRAENAPCTTAEFEVEGKVLGTGSGEHIVPGNDMVGGTNSEQPTLAFAGDGLAAVSRVERREDWELERTVVGVDVGKVWQAVEREDEVREVCSDKEVVPEEKVVGVVCALLEGFSDKKNASDVVEVKEEGGTASQVPGASAVAAEADTCSSEANETDPFSEVMGVAGATAIGAVMLHSEEVRVAEESSVVVGEALGVKLTDRVVVEEEFTSVMGVTDTGETVSATRVDVGVEVVCFDGEGAADV